MSNYDVTTINNQLSTSCLYNAVFVSPLTAFLLETETRRLRRCTVIVYEHLTQHNEIIRSGIIWFILRSIKINYSFEFTMMDHQGQSTLYLISVRLQTVNCSEQTVPSLFILAEIMHRKKVSVWMSGSEQKHQYYPSILPVINNMGVWHLAIFNCLLAEHVH